ncbi:MAG: hypothetical protein ABI040_09910 [Rhodoferax sp.]
MARALALRTRGWRYFRINRGRSQVTVSDGASGYPLGKISHFGPLLSMK